MPLFFPLSIFTGSFLLFIIQPLLSKAVLPYVGGAPAVWIVCMLFFQMLLLGGYAYAALGSSFLSVKRQISLHTGLMIFSVIIALPISLHSLFDIDEKQPEIWVLGALLLTIGLPYFLLSSNATLIQRWYYDSFGSSPYFLFSVSNFGSMLGLLAYPFLFEWMLNLQDQMQWWSQGYMLLTLLLVLLTWIVLKRQKHYEQQSDIGLGKNLPVRNIIKIICYGFIPSSLFLSVTMSVTTDIATFPLLWIIPLALYLLSFIIVFSKNAEKIILKSQKMHVVAVVLMLVTSLFLATKLELLIAFALINFIGFFVVALSIHGQAALEKPKPESLTFYYFWLSCGGALGGLFNTVAPYLFDVIYEHYIVLALSLFALPAKQLWGEQSFRQLQENKVTIAAVVLTAIGFVYLVSAEKGGEENKEILYEARSFFGVSRVILDKDEKLTIYKHGTTVHGFQSESPEHQLDVTSYYVPVKEFLGNLPQQFFAKPFGVLGLGAGTLACLGREGQQVDFFEIDPLVIQIAENEDYFTYVKDCPPDIKLIQGDGRLKLEAEPDQKYNLLIMDAFTSDAVPLHLLTLEAVNIYLDKIDRNRGILAFNISNRYMSLHGVLIQIANELGLTPYYLVYKESEDKPYDVNSRWLFMLPQQSPWHKDMLKMGFEAAAPVEGSELWTDSYSNILTVLGK